MPKDFAITVGPLQFHPPSFADCPLIASLRKLEGLEYRFRCRGPRNGYQLDSTFDIAAKAQLLGSGCQQISFVPNCHVSIDFDFVLDIHGDKIVFEIEKANKEKLLYDFLKMHVYLHHSEISAAVLIVPLNWAHSSGVQDLFSFARERFDLCKTYGMIDPQKAQRMLIVGAPQLYQGRPIDDRMMRSIKQECSDYFVNVASSQIG